MPWQDLLEEFKQIKDEKALRIFLEKHKFRMADSRSHPDQYVLGVFIGKIDERHAKLTHRLFDHLQSQAAGQDRNQLLLEIAGMDGVKSGFAGNY